MRLKVTSFLFTLAVFLHPAVALAQSDWINVKALGATGDGATDDTTPIVTAISQLPARGGTIYFPPGRYRLTARLTLPDSRVSLVGDGIGISTLEWTVANGGLLYQPTIAADPNGGDVGREFSLAKLTLRTSMSGGGTAIRAIWPEVTGQYANTATIRDVEVRGNSFARYWNSGIDMTGARQSTIENVVLIGSNSGYSLMGTGIRLQSNNGSTGYFIDRVRVFAANVGIKVEGGMSGTGTGPEGILIEQSHLVNVGIGVQVTTADAEPYTTVRGTHIDAHTHGINSNALHAVYSDNLIHHKDPYGVGIRVYGLVINAIVRNNIFVGSRPDNTNSVVFQTGVQRSSVTGNHFHSATGCVWFQAGSQSNFAAQNVFHDCQYKVYDQGVGNTVYGWGDSAP